MNHYVVLFSGGIDSTTALYWALAHSPRVTALTFDYGQRHRIEIETGKKLIHKLKLPHEFLHLDLMQIGGSALTDPQVPLPQGLPSAESSAAPPATYVPFRNGIFLALAAAWAEVHGSRDLVCGFNVIDSPNYPDTRGSFVTAMEEAINQGSCAAFTPEKFKLHAPFVEMKKSVIIERGLELGADYAYSISCYSGREIPCFFCSSCLLRRQAWEEVGREDHLLTRLKKEGRL
jgi:7-cyano-7-deazaguanine synthase